MARATRSYKSITDVLEREPVQNDDSTVTSPDYGLHRGDEGKPGAHWQVYLTRQRRRIVRIFYDRTYGGSAGAEKIARAYRDAIIAEIPQMPKPAVIQRYRETSTGITGVIPAHRKGELIGYEATFVDRSGQKRMLFTIANCGQEGARLRAEAQREFWIAEAMLAFIAINRKGDNPDNPLYSERLLASPHWLEHTETWLDNAIRKINARFDDMRPFWLTLRVAIYPGEKLVLTLSDGGRPAQQRKAVIMYATRGLDICLPLLREKAVTLINEIFGKPVADRFLADHSNKFEPKNFDPEKGISIREQP